MIADYLTRLACSLVIAVFVWLCVGVAAVAITERPVTLPFFGVLTLWACVFVGFEVAGFWTREER